MGLRVTPDGAVWVTISSGGVPNGAGFNAHDLAANADRVFLPEQTLDFNS